MWLSDDYMAGEIIKVWKELLTKCLCHSCNFFLIFIYPEQVSDEAEMEEFQMTKK